MENAKGKSISPGDHQWHWYRLAEMDTDLLYELMAFRESVFVVEQKCIYQELDGRDKTAHHYLAKSNGKVIACLRLLPPGSDESRVRIGRVAVAVDWRNQGLASWMVRQAIGRARSDYPDDGVFLDAQTYLRAFYEDLGFVVCGKAFLEDGIPHIPMELAL